MKKKNVISAKECMAVMKENFDNEMSIDWHGITVEVKKVIPYADMLAFVEMVFAACFADGGKYMPERFDMVFNACIVGTYTNITLPKDADDVYSILFNSDLIGMVMGIVNNQQIDSIRRAAERKIAHKLRTNENEINAAINKTVESIANLSSAVGDLFDGVTNEDIANVMSAIGNGKIDEEKLMEAYIKYKQPEVMSGE